MKSIADSPVLSLSTSPVMLEAALQTHLDTALTRSVISHSIYDTAWLARIPDGDSPRFPAALDSLIAEQSPDGSWGTPTNYTFMSDRLMNTLSAVVALAGWGLSDAVERGAAYLNKNLARFQ